MNWGIKVLQTSALPLGYGAISRLRLGKRCSFCLRRSLCNAYCVATTTGADYGARTRHLDLGKVALYQMS